MALRIKRASEPASDEDGTRVLVDRYWPRGIQREDAHIDVWYHEIAPSPELIAWYGHKRDRWEEFTSRYREELARPEAAARLQQLRVTANERTVTLVYGSRNREQNNARAILEYLDLPVEEVASMPWRPPAAIPTRPLPPPPARYRKPPRFRAPAFLGWLWIVFGLGVPIYLLLIGEALVVWQRRAVIVLGSILLAMIAITIIKSAVEERRTNEAMGIVQGQGDGRVSILVPMQELGFAVFGYVLGFAALVLALVAVSMLARVL